MLGWITRALNPPHFKANEDLTRKAGLLNSFSLVLILTQSLALLLPVYHGPIVRRASVAGSALIVAAVTLWLVRSRRVRAGSWTLVTGCWIVVTVAAFTRGGLHSPANYVYAIPVMCAGLLLGFRASLWIASATAAAELTMLIIGDRGALAAVSPAPAAYSLFIGQVLFLVLIATLLHMATYSIQRSLSRIRSSEQRFSKAFHCSPVPMCIGKDNRFIDVNDTLLRISGYSREYIIGRTPEDLVLFEDPAAGATLKAKLTEHGSVQNLEINLRMKDGNVRTHLISAEPIELGGEQCVLMAGIDISERKRAEDALRKTEAKFREFFQDSLTGNYISTPNGKLLACNPAFAGMLGFDSLDEAMSCNMTSAYPNPEDREHLLRLLRKHGRVERHEIQLRRRDGSQLYVIENAIGSFDHRGELVQLKGYAFDITESRKIEQQLIQTQKIEAIGRFAGGIAHDFNNLVTVVLGHSELLLRRLPEQPEQLRNDAQLIKQAADRAANLTRQLLAFSRQQVLDVRIIDLNSVVDGELEVLRTLVGNDIDFHAETEPRPLTVKADPSQIQQVIMNLVINARDAMQAGGELQIRTARTRVDEEFPNRQCGVPPGSYAMLEVRDTGAGMDERIQARIFEPFFTTKEKGKGTGLGLATVHGIVKQSGGHISVESSPGAGSIFRVFLPATGSCDSSPNPEADRNAASKGSQAASRAHQEGAADQITGIVTASDPQQTVKTAAESSNRGGCDYFMITNLLASNTNCIGPLERIDNSQIDIKRPR